MFEFPVGSIVAIIAGADNMCYLLIILEPFERPNVIMR